MKRTLVSLASVLAATTVTAASAQTFTFQSQGDPPTTAIVTKGPDGRTYSAMAFGGKGDTTWADGKKSAYTYKCVGMSQPTNDAIFMMHVTCEARAADGVYVVNFGCNNLAADELSCVGGLYGTGGAYVGRRGTITSHGKGQNTMGTGQWYN